MSRDRALLLALSAAAAASAVVLHVLLFDQGSLNNDEVAYLLQAKALARGELFLDVPQPSAASRVWFFVERPVGQVSKYLPLVSAAFAVGFWAVGSPLPVLAALAAAVPPLVAALAVEVGLGRREALLAAALVSASPLVLVQTALPLSYVAFLVLVTAGWLLLARIGLGRAGPGAALLLGLVGTAAAAARPYDAVLLLGPGALWAAWRRRAALPRLVPALVGGALPLTVAVLAYDARATGSALRLPFALSEPRDVPGFGRRRLIPEDSLERFGPLEGLHGLLLHFGLAPLSWYALGLVVVPAAALAWRRSGPVVRVLLVSAAAQLLGYAVFWGPWNFSVLWGRGTRVLGPIYAVPLVVPVVLAALPVLRDGLRRSRALRGLAAVAAAVSLVQLGSAVVQGRVDAGRTATVLAVAERGRAGGTLWLGVDPPYLGHPVSGLVAGTVLAAYAAVPAPGEPVPALLQLPKAVYGTDELTYALSRQQRVAGPRVELEVTLVDRQADVLVVERNGRATACRLRPATAVTLTPTGTAGCDSAPVPPGWPRNHARRCPDTTCLVLAVYKRDDAGDLRRRNWRQLPVDTGSGQVATVVDGEPVETSGDGWLRVTGSTAAAAPVG